MKKIIIAFVFFPVFLYAQVPGYQGKRFILSYNLDVVPNLTYIYLNLGDATIPVQVLFNNHLNAEYVLGRRFSLGADLSYSQNKPFFVNGHASETSSTYGVNFIFYPNHNNTLAPVGNYFKIRAFTGSLNASGIIILDNGTDYYNNEVYINKQEEATLKIEGFGIGFGNNMVVHKNIVLTASVDMDWNFTTANGSSASKDNNADLYFYSEDHLLDDYLFYFKLGIGGLLF